MKYLKSFLIAALGVVFPFALLKAIIEFEILIDFFDTILFLYPVYLPILCGCFGIMAFKATNKILFPTLFFNAFLTFSTFILSLMMILNSKDRSLTDSLVFLLLFGPTLYSIPISPIASAIYKKKIKKQSCVETRENQNNQ